jgi:putative membrane protein
MGHGLFGYGYGGGFGGPLVMIAFWVLLVAGVLWLLGRMTGRTHGSCCSGHETKGHGPGADEILKQRYARGEITHDEFTRMMGEITGAQPKGGGGYNG